MMVTGVLMSAPESAASSPVREVIRLHCAMAEADVTPRAADMLCRQMVQALASARPGSNIRRVSADQATPLQSHEVTVHLNLTAPAQATLGWQHGPTGVPQSAPVQDLEVSVETASPAQHRQMADDLLHHAPALLSLLKTASHDCSN